MILAVSATPPILRFATIHGTAALRSFLLPFLLEPDLSVTVNGLHMPNPFVIGLGPPGTNYMMKRAFDEGWGAVIAKTGDFLVHFMHIARDELTKKLDDISVEKLQVTVEHLSVEHFMMTSRWIWIWIGQL
ncbi:hypothetical protein FNV43_RR21652 [Rhamnella rubrinervis]|uniref:Uncharacterized protein n=1 Tax=Rhamnella rubrinervis TaxID=2594499 RepID=A0A8K0DNS9_9ROSA|nr:hypothetical protein FNV43_RR21652 [Rhamnella rubrinervis]